MVDRSTKLPRDAAGSHERPETLPLRGTCDWWSIPLLPCERIHVSAALAREGHSTSLRGQSTIFQRICCLLMHDERKRRGALRANGDIVPVCRAEQNQATGRRKFRPLRRPLAEALAEQKS